MGGKGGLRICVLRFDMGRGGGEGFDGMVWYGMVGDVAITLRIR